MAASLYFVALFTLGFILGTLRTLVVAPITGAFVATAAEVPIMVAAAFFLCRWAVHRWHVPCSTLPRLVMTAWFLILLALAESILGTLLFGRSVADQVASLATPAGLIGLTAQLIAAFLPIWIARAEPATVTR